MQEHKQGKLGSNHVCPGKDAGSVNTWKYLKFTPRLILSTETAYNNNHNHNHNYYY